MRCRVKWYRGRNQTSIQLGTIPRPLQDSFPRLRTLAPLGTTPEVAERYVRPVGAAMLTFTGAAFTYLRLSLLSSPAR